jgi:hypothetical protein
MKHFRFLRGLVSCFYLTIRMRQSSGWVVIASDTKISDEYMREKVKHIKGDIVHFGETGRQSTRSAAGQIRKTLPLRDRYYKKLISVVS